MKNYIFLSLIFYAFSFSHGRLSERYHTYEEVRDSLFSWNEQFGQNQEPNELYPGSGIIYYLEEIGVSSHEGLPFWGVRLSFNADQKQDKPRILLLGQCHAEEILGVEITMEIISMFLHPEDHQEWHYNMAALLYSSEIWILPTHNPEGLRVVHGYEEDGHWIQDESFRKNKTDVNLNGIFDYVVGVGNDSDGVDLNRNYDFNWIFGDGPYEYDNGVGSYQSHYDYYKGHEPFSELELQAIRDFAFREDFLLSVSYHSSRSGSVAEKVIYSWLWEDSKPSPDLEVISEIGDEIANKIIREDGGGGYLPVAHGTKKGNAHDWFYSQTGTIQYLIEVGTQNMQPNDINLIEGTIDRNLNGVFYMMNRAIGYNFGDLAAPANQVSGIISNSETGEIIENAQVKILEMDGGMLKPRLSDEFGRYRRLLSNGSYTMQISAEGYYSQEIIVNSSSATITYRNIELNPRQNYVLELNLNIPDNYQLPIYIDIVSDVKTYTYNINDGINLLDLYADNYQLKVYSQDLFTQFFEYNLFENSTFYIDLNYSETIFEENFDNLNNWSIISGNWSLENGNLVSQTSLTYDEGAFWKIKYNEDIFVNDNVQVNLVLDFKKEFEWEHDYAFFDFDANNNSYEFYAQDHNWNQHKLEIPIDNINQLIIGIYADSTVQYRGLEIDNLKLVSQPLLQESNSIEESLPQEFKINRIAPNPFNPSTLITYQIPENGEIKIEVLNVAGQKIENIYSGYKKAGKHEVKWYSKNISSGFYFVKIHLNERISKTEKVMLLK
ncbi:MAG: M14 family zinc carboxypeptidase [Candidatus Neomarinimicrobiota bacterium]|nr:M14 family zinc carboxypeptidase [Candidatus Neomarinimicrobiota bacterium]